MDKFKQLGTALTEIREGRGLTQPEIASIAGVTTQTIYRVEKGAVSDPKIDTWKGVCKGYEVSATWISKQLGDQAPKRLRLLAKQQKETGTDAPTYEKLTDTSGQKTLYLKTEDVLRLGQLLGQGNVDEVIASLQRLKHTDD